jgi:hypothetical protein
VADNDFGIGQRRSKPLRIALVLEDLGFQGRFQLGSYPPHCRGDHGDWWRRGARAGRWPMITRRAFDDWLEPRRNDMSLPNPAKRAIVA